MDANNTNEEISIDVKKLWEIAKQRKKIIAAIIIFCTVIATILAFVLPKTYQSTTLVRVKSQDSNSVLSGYKAMAESFGINIGGGSSLSPESAMALMQSREVLEPIMESLDLPDEDKNELTTEDFIKKYLEFNNITKTDLISIAAYGKTPEEAQKISQSIADNFLTLMTKLSREDNSTSLKFLDEQVKIAKEDMEKAEDELSAYQQEKKIYAPDKQAEAIITNMSAYDSNIAQLEAEMNGNNAKLNSATNQLEQQNTDLLKYNVSDNQNVGNLREAIVNKRVEIVGLEQRYTDAHPDVIKAKEELKMLEGSLSQEISNAVNSQSVTLSPVQSSLLKDKLDAETNVAVDEASLEVLKAKQSEAENDIGTLSADGVEYARLLRKVKIANEIYTSLFKYYEQTKLEEAKTAMDIQIVDPADLPKEDLPAKPKKKLVVGIGFIVGIIISFGYTLLNYSRKYGL